MAPKKKGNKKAQDDDWEAELGESVAPQDSPAGEKEEAAPDDDDALGGGLMAALQRRGKKKNKKGAQPELPGEDPADNVANGDLDLDSKAPQEGTFDDDDDDVFAGNYGKKKGKGVAAAATAAAAPVKTEEVGENNADGTPRVKTKAEKEREKKEKEKQRKKELVRLKPYGVRYAFYRTRRLLLVYRLQRRKPRALPKPSQQSLRTRGPYPLLRLRPPHLRLRLQRQVARRRSLVLPWPFSRNSKKNVGVERKRLLAPKQRRRLGSRNWRGKMQKNRSARRRQRR